MPLEITRPDVVVPVAVDPSGLRGPTKGQSRSKRWRRTSPGRYVPSATDSTRTDQRVVEAAAGGLDGSAVTGWAALNWQGARWFSGRNPDGTLRPVPLAVGDRKLPAARRGVVLLHHWLYEGDVITVDGLPVTRPERSTITQALRASGFESTVQVFDMALASDLVSKDELVRYLELLHGRPHTRRLRSALTLAEENVWSPMETTMRLRWASRHPRARLVCNQPVFSPDGEHLFTPDLLDPDAQVAGEYDGVVHDERRVRRRDVHREELARSVGIEVVRMVSADLRDVASFEQRLDRAYAEAAARPRTSAWTLTPPRWWHHPTTVAGRRDRRLASAPHP